MNPIMTATPANAPANARTGALWVVNGQVVTYTGTQWIPLVPPVTKEKSVADFRITYTATNVNTKSLLTYIVKSVEEASSEFVFQRSSTLAKTYDFSQLVEYIDLMLADLVDDKKIVTYEVIGDLRNNHHDAMRAGKMCIEVNFRQFNCLNTTKIVFHVQKN